MKILGHMSLCFEMLAAYNDGVCLCVSCSSLTMV